MEEKKFQPYVPADKVVPEFTVFSVVLGALLAIVFGGANAYLGLRVGMTVSASIPADLTGRGGAPAASGGGDTTVTNHFHIEEFVVREEADIKKISRELYNMQKTKSRSKGVSMA